MLLAVALLSGMVGFTLIEGYSLIEAFYMTVITISTVGFTEVRPLSSTGQIFASILIMFNIGIFAYSVSVFTSLVIEGELFRKIHLQTIRRNIKLMKNHIIVCGYGRYGSRIVEHLLDEQMPFVVIEKSSEKIAEIQKSDDKILYIQGDATHDEVLLQAGLHRAKVLITPLSDDTDNLFTVLSARQLSDSTQIISSAQSQQTERKLKKAGANHVIMPDRLGGLYMSMLISKPGAVEFFSYISNEFASDIGMAEVQYKDLPKPCLGKSIQDLGIPEHTQVSIIGMKKSNDFVINPSPDTILESDSSFIVIGSKSQLAQFRNHLETILP